MRSMRSHVTKTVSACFSVLRQLRSIRRSVPRSVLQTLVTSLVRTRLDYDNSTLAGIPLYLLKRLQSALNSAVRLLLNSSRYDHVAPLLRQRHWLMATPQLTSPLCTVGLSHIGIWVSVLMSCSYSVLLCFKFGFFCVCKYIIFICGHLAPVSTILGHAYSTYRNDPTFYEAVIHACYT